jgi:hypothetical protein
MTSRGLKLASWFPSGYYQTPIFDAKHRTVSSSAETLEAGTFGGVVSLLSDLCIDS